jgi:hypothetical protein
MRKRIVTLAMILHTDTHTHTQNRAFSSTHTPGFTGSCTIDIVFNISKVAIAQRKYGSRNISKGYRFGDMSKMHVSFH